MKEDKTIFTVPLKRVQNKSIQALINAIAEQEGIDKSELDLNQYHFYYSDNVWVNGKPQIQFEVSKRLYKKKK